MTRPITIGLNAVILAVTDEEPSILTIRQTEAAPEPAPGRAGARPATLDALPFGPLDPEAHRTLELGLRAWVRQQTGIEFGYVEQLYTFGDRDREPGRSAGAARVISVAYLALVREEQLDQMPEAGWRDWYGFFPWEDWRSGKPAIIDRIMLPPLRLWVDSAPNRAARAQRQERVDIAFGLGGAPWDGERVLRRYELLWEAGLVHEAHRDRSPASAGRAAPKGELGLPMFADHRRILATALSRLRGKIRYRPVVFELLPPTFTLLQLQRVVESLAGLRLHKQNFRRLVEKGGLVEGTGRIEEHTGGRPAELFRFRREVLRERPAPGVGLPGVRV